MITKTIAAAIRAVLVANLAALPSLILPHETADMAQFVAIMSLLLGGLVFIEYAGRTPSLTEFRYAPPYNRIRFTSFAGIVLILSLIYRSLYDSAHTDMTFVHIGKQFQQMLDFPFSPIKTFVWAYSSSPNAQLSVYTEYAASLAFAVAFSSVIIFIFFLKLCAWPHKDRSFNIFINIPSFNPTGGSDVLMKFNRAAVINLLLGISLPYLAPILFYLTCVYVKPIAITGPQSLIWIISIWAFLPASFLMRSFAFNRIARLVERRRRINKSRAETGRLLNA